MRGARFWIVAVAVAIISLGVVAISIAASVPQIINYQGTLTSNGTKPTGPINMAFKVYSTSTGSTPLWTENWSSSATPSNPVIVTNGSFNVMLGALNPFPSGFFADHPKTYLGITVGTDSEMLPRQQFASVGYSFTSGNGVPKGGIIMWSGAVNQVPDGWALCDGTNGTPDLRDRFVVAAGSGYAVGAIGGSSSINLQHSHNYSGTTSTATRNDYDDRTKNGSLYHTLNDNHTHTYSGTTDGGTLSSNQDIRPPFYALAFIMKF
ncbi:hypothetical protein [Geomonas sp. Red276]